MMTKTMLTAATAFSLLAMPVMAQRGDAERSGHHYSGGPKTEVPHHMGKKQTTGSSKKARSGGHHYTGGPATGTPHHMGEKQ
ncbi:hypothetical protein I6F35_03090 [Bradyrhizobium sp. BRP22]|uniref:hypothetical protein n=1 Tax=Bradyrhizobium sp. BRP22 TaxID=2793821 RepID=UPI001CD6224D|nr:hypothetical protein [Bradyrhizobium sp. BRP22]MCA1452201.1 hypothetical protein [Bradyrhizobium sp. BRP22]